MCLPFWGKVRRKVDQWCADRDMHAKRLWSLWQAWLLDIASGFTNAGRRRFVE